MSQLVSHLGGSLLGTNFPRIFFPAIYVFALSLFAGCGSDSPTTSTPALQPLSDIPPSPVQDAPPPSTPTAIPSSTQEKQLATSEPTSPSEQLPVEKPSSTPTDNPDKQSFDSPESTFNLAELARNGGDVESLISCFTKEGLDHEIGATMLVASGFSEQLPPPFRAPFVEFVEQHQILAVIQQSQQIVSEAESKPSMQQVTQQLGSKIADPSKYLKDWTTTYQTFLREMRKQLEKEGDSRNPTNDYVLLDIAIQGEQAHGYFQVNGFLQKPLTPIYFVKRDRRWLIDGYPIGASPLEGATVQPPLELTPRYFDRPEKAYRALKAGAYENDASSGLACATQEGRYFEIGRAAIQLQQALMLPAATDDQKKELLAAAREAGLSIEIVASMISAIGDPTKQPFYDATVKLGKSIKDPITFIKRLRSVLGQKDQEGQYYIEQSPEPKIEAVTLQDDRATLHINFAPGIPDEYGMEVYCRKSEDGWQVSFDPSHRAEGEKSEPMDEGPYLTWRGYDLNFLGKPLEEADVIFLLLHGLGANKEDLAEVAELIAADKSIAVVLPQGRFKLGEGRYSYVGDDEEAVERRFRNTVMDFKRIASELKIKYPQKQVALGGFSQGGTIALNVLCSSVQPYFDRVVIFSAPPLLEREPSPFTPHLPILFVQGTEDAVVDEAKVDTLITNLKMKAFPVEVIKFEGGHEIPRDKMDDIRAFLLKE